MIPILELKSQYYSIKQEIDDAIERVLARQNFILGEEVEALEKEIAEYCNARYAIGVSSGTDALMVSLMAVGIKPGDNVITTPYTFFSTSSAITRLGATPVYVDINPDFNINAHQIEAEIDENTRAILPVQFAGKVCDMNTVMEIGNRYNLPVIEDACQSIGATYHGKMAGAIGDIGCFSFYPSKNLGGYGDGGMVVTDHKDLADKIRILRNHGQHPKYIINEAGGNFRMDEIQAAVLRAKLPHLEEWIDARNYHARLYRQYLHSVDLPQVELHCRHTYHLFIVRSNRRDYLEEKLRKNGIGSGVYYPVPLHLQPCYEYLGYNVGDFPESEKASKENLAIPVYPELSERAIEYISKVIEAE